MGGIGGTGDGELNTHNVAGDQAELGVDGLTDVVVVGSGGSSTVYRARQEALDRTVAVKVVHAAWSIATRERFEHEREVMGRLSGHAAIVPIFETGMTRRGEPYLLMPFYSRGSLFRLMKDRGPLPWREAVYIIEALTQALADSHDEGIVHRDVKPGNVMLTRHLQPRLADFGITLAAGTVTDGSAVAYTPSYSPPEAFDAGQVEPTADVYSLGATLWALLAGRAPFTEPGESVDVTVVMERSLRDDLGSPEPSTPKPIVDVVARAMARDPRGRPPDARVFAAELRRAVRLSEQGESTPSQARSTPDLVMISALTAMMVAGILLLIAAVGWLLLN